MQFLIGFIVLIFIFVIFSIVFFPLIPFFIAIAFLLRNKLKKEGKTFSEFFKEATADGFSQVFFKGLWLLFKLVSAFIVWMIFTTILWGVFLRKTFGFDAGLVLAMIINLFWFYIFFKKEIDWLREEPVKYENPVGDKYAYINKVVEELINNKYLSKDDKEKILREINSILLKVKQIEELKEVKKIPEFEVYEISKLVNTLVSKILTTFLKEPTEENITKLFEAINITKSEVDRVYKNYIGDPSEKLEKEIEFLKRKYLK